MPARLRANIHHSTSLGLYYEEVSYTTVDFTPDGLALTSVLDSGEHAPVLDVDRPVTTTAHHAGTKVTITGPYKAAKVRAAQAALNDAGLIHPDTLTLPLEPKTWWQARRGRVGQVELIFPFPVLALGSKTPGHHHLLVQKAMDWATAENLARILARAGIVDRSFERISSKGDFMYVNNPTRTFDKF